MKRRVARISLAILGSVAALSGGAARAATDDLDEVMHLLAARHHGQVSFVEQHFLSLLKRPAESSGELIYDASNRARRAWCWWVMC